MAVSIFRPLSGQTGPTLFRIVIAFYFVAVSLGLIAGTGATPLANAYLSPEPAALIGRSAFFILGYLVLTGIWLRPAAMILAVILFWSSYIAHFAPGATAPPSGFWPDLIMVAALIFIYTRRAPSGVRHTIVPRRVIGITSTRSNPAMTRRLVAAELPSNIPRLPVTRANSGGRSVENIFRDDLEEMLAS